MSPVKATAAHNLGADLDYITRDNRAVGIGLHRCRRVANMLPRLGRITADSAGGLRTVIPRNYLVRCDLLPEVSRCQSLGKLATESSIPSWLTIPSHSLGTARPEVISNTASACGLALPLSIPSWLTSLR